MCTPLPRGHEVGGRTTVRVFPHRFSSPGFFPEQDSRTHDLHIVVPLSQYALLLASRASAGLRISDESVAPCFHLLLELSVMWGNCSSRRGSPRSSLLTCSPTGSSRRKSVLFGANSLVNSDVPMNVSLAGRIWLWKASLPVYSFSGKEKSQTGEKRWDKSTHSVSD